MLGSGQGSGDNTSVATGIMDPDYYPVITLVPVGEYANINPWVGTDVQYVAGQGWYFSIIRSIGSTNNNYESMDIIQYTGNRTNSTTYSRYGNTSYIKVI